MIGILPYLNFDGTCREAMTFYQSCLGGELNVTTFGEGDFEIPPGSEDRVIHAHLQSGPVVLMASDSMPGMPFHSGNDVWINLACGSDEEVERLYAALSAGGREVMGPHDSFWGARFAMFTDRFGKSWMLNHERPRGTG